VDIFREGSVSHELRTSDSARDRATVLASSSDDPLAPARARGERSKREILAAQGEMLDTAGVAARLGVSTRAVGARRQRGLLLALPLDDGTWAFTAWPFYGAENQPRQEDVLRHMSVSGPWMRAGFFLSGDLRLNGRTPLDMLRRGEIDAVRDAGAAYGEHGAD
jgi:hypothetical protein